MHGDQGKGIPDQVFKLPKWCIQLAIGCHLVPLDMLAQEPNKMVSSTGSNQQASKLRSQKENAFRTHGILNSFQVRQQFDNKNAFLDNQ
jgi:hypothetical protein